MITWYTSGWSTGSGTLDAYRSASLKRLPLRAWTSRWAGASPLTKTVSGPVPAAYVSPNRARRLVPSSRSSSDTSPTRASGCASAMAAVIHSAVTSSHSLGMRDCSTSCRPPPQAPGAGPLRTASSTSSMTQVIAADRVRRVELPVDDQPLVRHDAPQHVEHRRRDRAVDRRPRRRRRRRPRRAAPRAGGGWRRRRVASRGVRGAIGNDDTYSRIRAVTSATSSRREPVHVDAGFLFEPVASPRRAARARSRSTGRRSAR